MPRAFAASAAIATGTGAAPRLSLGPDYGLASPSQGSQSSGDAVSQWEDEDITICANCILQIRCSLYRFDADVKSVEWAEIWFSLILGAGPIRLLCADDSRRMLWPM
jgi:hypothetical protein